jgi:predicted nucleic acid-binding protein
MGNTVHGGALFQRMKPHNQPTILVDSDAFVALFWDADTNHAQADQLFEDRKANRFRLIATSFVMMETATVLSHRKGQEAARTFLDYSTRLPVIHITEALQQEAMSIFREQTKKGTSVVDCANVAVMRRYGIQQIFSFDKVYTNHFGLAMVA